MFVQYVKDHLNGEGNGDSIGKRLSIAQKNVHQKNEKSYSIFDFNFFCNSYK